MTDPIRPGTIPPDVEVAAHTAFLLTSGSNENRIRAAVAAALNLTREQIADWVGGERVLTNAEMTDVADEVERGPDGDPGKVYVAYCARLVRDWPGRKGQ